MLGPVRILLGEVRMDRQAGTAKLATEEQKGRNPRWTAGWGQEGGGDQTGSWREPDPGT